MKILIFENEIKEVRRNFELVNTLDFDDKLEFNWVTKSQDFEDLSKVHDFNLVIIDIDLSTKSVHDGYSLLDLILKEENYSNVFVMSGHEVEKELKEKGLKDVDLLKKPVILDELSHLIRSYCGN